MKVRIVRSDMKDLNQFPSLYLSNMSISKIDVMGGLPDIKPLNNASGKITRLIKYLSLVPV